MSRCPNALSGPVSVKFTRDRMQKKVANRPSTQVPLGFQRRTELPARCMLLGQDRPVGGWQWRAGLQCGSQQRFHRGPGLAPTARGCTSLQHALRLRCLCHSLACALRTARRSKQNSGPWPGMSRYLLRATRCDVLFRSSSSPSVPSGGAQARPHTSFPESSTSLFSFDPLGLLGGRGSDRK